MAPRVTTMLVVALPGSVGWLERLEMVDQVSCLLGITFFHLCGDGPLQILNMQLLAGAATHDPIVEAGLTAKVLPDESTGWCDAQLACSVRLHVFSEDLFLLVVELPLVTTLPFSFLFAWIDPIRSPIVTR